MFNSCYHKTKTVDASAEKKSKHHFFQPKLSINQPNDVYEQEANSVADKIMQQDNISMNPFFKPASIQRQTNDNNIGNPTATDNYIGNLSGGKQMNNGERSFFESRLGYDLSDVRIHNDNSAHQSAKNINALAYTTGNNIVFGADTYHPETTEGKKLLAHELTHIKL